MNQPPAVTGMDLANWNWKVLRRFALESFSISMSCTGCLNYPHRLGFSFKRPKERLLKADEGNRAAFVAEYAAMWAECRNTEARIFFADEATFRADAQLQGKSVQQAEPAPVESTSPKYGEEDNYYSTVCLETGKME